eukprot:TRINITY_DN13028_c0_g1_i1.p1 TRINITY_DN13028_c0_g1~~TRINITY_DN13028_c0_g1_i1.p1  ORF type:complete len:189 (-),score=32.03 TRINITY_DN13028_c0_g1_i1:27-593(-)
MAHTLPELKEKERRGIHEDGGLTPSAPAHNVHEVEERALLEEYLNTLAVDDDRPPGETMPALIMKKGFEDHAKFHRSQHSFEKEVSKIGTFEGKGYTLGAGREESAVANYTRVSVQIEFYQDGYRLSDEEAFVIHSYRSSTAEQLLMNVVAGCTPPAIMELLWDQGRCTGPVKLQVVDQTHTRYRRQR